jgi:hypothetical protein
VNEPWTSPLKQTEIYFSESQYQAFSTSPTFNDLLWTKCKFHKYRSWCNMSNLDIRRHLRIFSYHLSVNVWKIFLRTEPTSAVIGKTHIHAVIMGYSSDDVVTHNVVRLFMVQLWPYSCRNTM